MPVAMLPSIEPYSISKEEASGVKFSLVAASCNATGSSAACEAS
jgi:hypothetical protein